MRRVARRTWLITAEIGGTLLLIVSILVTLIRIGLPQVDRLHDLAEQWATEAAGRPVQIGALDTFWQGFNPSIILRDVRLLDDSGLEVLGLDSADVEIDLFDTIAAGEVVFGKLHFNGLGLVVERGPDGLILADADVVRPADPETGVDEKAVAERGMQADEVLAWIFSQRGIEISSAQVWWTGLAKPQILNVALQIRNEADRHRIAVLIQPAGSDGEVLLRGDLSGSPEHPELWRGPIYLRTRNMEPGLLLDTLPAISESAALAPLRQAIGTLPAGFDLEAWSRFRMEGPERVVGNLRMHRLQDGAGDEPERIARAGARFDWEQSSAGGWRLDLADVSAETADGSALWVGPAAVAVATDGAISAGISALSIDELGAFIAGIGSVDQATREMLRGLQPGGMLYRISASQEPAAATWQVGGEVWGAGNHAWQKVPGVSGLRGTWLAGPDRFDMQFDSYRVVADLPGLFRDPLQIDRVQGGVGLHRMNDGWRLSSGDLELTNGEIASRTRFTVDLPDGDERARMDLLVELSGDVAAKSKYLPAGIMEPKLVDWLDKAIVGGRLKQGSILVQGALADFPFRDGNGRFEMQYETEDATLKFLKDWPRIEALDATVRLDGKSVLIDLADGRIANASIRSAKAVIAEATLDGERVLRIDGQLDGTLADVTRFLANSPLYGRFAGYLETVQVEGPMVTTLELEIPLRGGPVHTRGAIDVHDAVIAIPATGIELGEVHGRLGFSELSLEAKGIKATWDGEPVDFDLRIPGVVNGNPVAVRVDGRGSVGAARIGAWLPDGHAQRTTGKTRLDGTVGVLAGEDGRPGDVRLDLHSTLQGLAVDLPRPFGKGAGSERPLMVGVDFVAGESTEFSARYGDDTTLYGRLAAKGQAPLIERAELRVGDEAARLPDTPGWRITADVDRVAIGDWLAVVTAGEGSGGPQHPMEINLKSGLLEFGSLPMHAASLNMRRGGSGWLVAIDSDEIAGDIGLPSPFARGSLIKAKLTRCLFPRKEDDPGADSAAERAPSPDPTTLPGMRISCERFATDGAELGRMTVNAEAEEGGLRISRLEFDSPMLNLAGTGHWRMTSNGPQTTMQMGAQAPRIDQVLEAFAFQSPVANGEMRANMDLGWHGAPYQMRVASLNGALSLAIGSGEVRELEPGVGRLFGLLSVATVGRRLRLDFSDFFQAGLVFDEMRGNFTLDAGEAYTSNFTLDAPSAAVVIMGRTGLVEKDYDQLITVTPKVSSSLPVVGALAGGPVVGAAAFLFERVFGSTINEITRTQYAVTGSWDAPLVRRLLPGEGAPVETR